MALDRVLMRAQCSLATGVDGTRSTSQVPQGLRSGSRVSVGGNQKFLHFWSDVSSLHCWGGVPSLHCRSRAGLSRARDRDISAVAQKLSGNFLDLWGFRICGVSRWRCQAEQLDVAHVNEQDGLEKKPDEVTETKDDDNEDYGIDELGYIEGGLPEEWKELMKEVKTPANYWVVGAILTALFITRKAIWAELKNWGKFALYVLTVVLDLVIIALGKMTKLGGDPLMKVIIVVSWVVLTAFDIVRFIAELVQFWPVMSAVTLSSLVLLAGEGVSDTYSSRYIPSRNIVDIAGILGLFGFVGILPLGIMILGLLAITVYLLGVKKANPVAGLTPAIAALTGVATPVLRYPLVTSFVGWSVFRYWKLGYLSHGAVLKERTAEYPRVLQGLLYLVVFALVARPLLYMVDSVHAAILVLLQNRALQP